MAKKQGPGRVHPKTDAEKVLCLIGVLTKIERGERVRVRDAAGMLFGWDDERVFKAIYLCVKRGWIEGLKPGNDDGERTSESERG